MYTAAVSTSIGVGLGVRKLLTPYSNHFKGPRQLFFNFLISFAAVGTASFANCLLMRSKEMKEGIMLRDKEGNEVGKSQIIGRKAVLQTGVTRYIMPIAPLLIPTVTFYFLEKKKLVPKNRIAKLFVDTAVFMAALTFAPPLACAVFPQNA